MRQVERCGLKANMDEINWSYDFYSEMFCKIVSMFLLYFFFCLLLESRPLADYILLIRCICAFILHL